MAKILWSVDEKIYNDQTAHTLILKGWAAQTEGAECEFSLKGDGEEITISAPERFDRADVSHSLDELREASNIGFAVKIPEIRELTGRYKRLELTVTAEQESAVLWETATEELEKFCTDSLLEYHIDREEILGKTTLLIEGWVLDQLGSDEIIVEDKSHTVINCKIRRMRRPDVLEERKIKREENNEIGFSLSIDLSDERRNEFFVYFKGAETEKCQETEGRKISISPENEAFILGEQRKELCIYQRKRSGRFCSLCGNLSAG